jgi:predicted dehydrogenase
MRVAFVGTGGVALRHLEVLAPLPNFEIVGHISADAARAQAQADRWGGRGYALVEEMLDAERPDAVWMCVTPDRHGALEMALIERRIPFFVEKPLAVDLEPAESIARALAATSLVVGVGYKFRALDTLPRVSELLRESPPRMAIGAWHGSLPSPPWWRKAARSGGQIVEQATHLVDLARLLLGEGVVVGAVGGRWPRMDYPDSDVADTSAALLRFGDVPAVFSASCVLPAAHAIELQLVCQGRVLTITEARVRVAAGEETTELATRRDPFLVEDLAFIEAVESGEPKRVLSSYADALETHLLCCAIRAGMARYQAVQPQSTGSVTPVI